MTPRFDGDDRPAAVRVAGPQDAAAIAAIYGYYVDLTVVSFEYEPPGQEEIARRMTSAPRMPWLVAERDGGVVGYAYGTRHRARDAYRWAAEVSVYLHGDERGGGTGRLLYERLLPELAQLGYVSAYAGIALPNDASVRLHESLGFHSVGVFRAVGYKHGRWRDTGWWQRTLVDPLPTRPQAPREWSG